MYKKSAILTTGFALFSMFFGSGNLVFPIALGASHGEHALHAAVGLLLTGVAVPFLGVYTMCLFHGDSAAFFRSCGSRAPFWFSLLCLGLLGPFGVIARCLTVAHGSLHLIWPQLPLNVTSFFLSLSLYLFARKKELILHLLGNLMTPTLIACLALLGYFGLIAHTPVSHSSATLATLTPSESLIEGLFQGYQTMDLLASFFFSTFLFHSLIATQEESDERVWIGARKLLIKASLVGATLLASVYGLMVALGTRYSGQLASIAPQDMLGRVAFITLGELGGPIVCITVLLACLTTALVLTSLFATFLQKEISQKKLSERSSLVITLIIAFLVSTLDFSGICSFLGPILEVIYPSLIALTLVGLAHKTLGLPITHWPATVALIARLGSFYL